MPDRTDRSESQRPQERDLTFDKWDKFPFPKEDDPYENRSEDAATGENQSAYSYEGWEEKAFPNKNVSETPAESSADTPPEKPSSGKK